MLIVSVYLALPGLEHKYACADTEDRPIPMRLEIILDAEDCVPFENFTLKVRMLNPNTYPVRLPGFSFGYIEPEIYVLDFDGNPHRLYYGAMDSARTGVPVTIPPGGVLEHHRFLYDGFSWERWPAEPGTYLLYANTQLCRSALGANDNRLRIDWTCPTVEVIVRQQSARDRAAIEFLRKRLIERREAVRRGGAQRSGVFRAALYGEFLERYPDSVYVPEIRWALTKLLPIELGYEHGPLHDDPEMVQLLEECVTFCLDRGGAYSEEFLSWKPDGKGNHLMRLARRYQRFELLKRIAKELAAKHPDDKPAIMFRQVIVTAVTESKAAGQRAAEKLRQRFPESPYVERASQLLKYLDRQAEREKSEAP